MDENAAVMYILSWLEAYVYLKGYHELDRGSFPGIKDIFGEEFKLWLKGSCELDENRVEQICKIATTYQKELVFSAMDFLTPRTY